MRESVAERNGHSLTINYIFDLRAELPPGVGSWGGLKTVSDFLDTAVASLPGLVEVGRWEAEVPNGFEFEPASLSELKAIARKDRLAPDVVIHMKWVHREGHTVMLHLGFAVSDDYSSREIAVMFHFEDRGEAYKMEDELQRFLHSLKNRRRAWSDLVVSVMTVDDHEREKLERHKKLQQRTTGPLPGDDAGAGTKPTRRASRNSKLADTRPWKRYAANAAIGLVTAVGGGIAVGYALFQFGWI